MTETTNSTPPTPPEGAFNTKGRPFLLWVFSFAVLYQYIGVPLLSWYLLVWHAEIPPPPQITEGFWSLVLGSLGLYGLRGWEKVQLKKS